MFVLAPNKDLAVSPPRSPSRLTLSDSTGCSSSFELERLCSHLYHFWRRLLAAIFLTHLKNQTSGCSDFPPLTSADEE